MLTVLGEAIIDLVADSVTSSGAPGRRHEASSDRFTARPGGSPLNVAVGLSRLGHHTQFMARRADDAFGRILSAHAADNGVGLDSAPAAAEPSTLAVVSLDEQGRASYDFYIDGTADWQWAPEELAARPAGAEVFHTGSLASWTSPGDAGVLGLMHELHGSGDTLLTYDPNVRPRLLGDAERGRRLVERFVENAHVVKASDEDLAFLYPDEDPERVMRRWLELGPTVTFLTRGELGASAFTRDGTDWQRRPLKVELVDTIGAGDAFMAGLIDAIVTRDLAEPDALAALDQPTLDDILATAGLVAALTCEQSGAEPPTREQVQAARNRLH